MILCNCFQARQIELTERWTSALSGHFTCWI